MRDWRHNTGFFASLAIPPVAWLLVLFLLPLGGVWLLSFGENSGLAEVSITGTLANYQRALEPLYLEIMLKSLWIAGATTLICLIAGFPVALAIVFAQPRAKTVLLLLVMLPFWTNLLIRTYALIAVLRTNGFLNGGLGWVWDGVSAVVGLLGLGSLAPFQPLQLLYTDFAVVFGLVYVHLPFMVLPLYAALERIDRSLIEASLDLGAGHLRTMVHVVWPLALPGIVSGVIVTMVPALGAYLTPDLLGGPSSQLIANVIERQFKRANDWPFGAALSFLLMYATFIALFVRSIVARAHGQRGGGAL